MSALDLDLCIPHKRIGRLVRAIHTVNQEGMCGPCFRGVAIDETAGAPVSALKKTEAKPMPARKQIDWAAVQRDRDAGVAVTELEKKYDVSNPTIYARTHGKNGAAKVHFRKIGKVRTNERTNERTKSPLEGQSERSWL
jgi:hypothetical protein